MKLLHIMTSVSNGGAETYAADVITRLHTEGVDQCVVMSPKAARFAGLRSLGVRMAPEVLRFPVPALQRRAVLKLIDTEQPDFVQTWMRRGAALAKGSRSRVIGWFGGYYDMAHFSHCERIVGVTRDITAHMVKNGAAADRTNYIPTFPVIDEASAADRASLETSPEAKVLLTLSRLHEKKGLDTLLSALQSLPECVAWLAGDGPLQGDLERQARNLGIADRVRFLGWRTDRAALLRAADICILPSRYEPFGTVILEAWSAGTPLVACASAGPAAHITDGVNGLLTPIGDAPALAAAIRRLLDEPALAADMRSAGHVAYLKHFTPEAVTAQWLDFYRGLGLAPGSSST